MDNKYNVRADDQVLVTGSNGFIGKRVVRTLIDYGFSSLRCLVRSSSDISGLQEILSRHQDDTAVELVRGDLLSKDDCRRATEGVSIVYHLAAGIEKSFAG